MGLGWGNVPVEMCPPIHCVNLWCGYLGHAKAFCRAKMGNFWPLPLFGLGTTPSTPDQRAASCLWHHGTRHKWYASVSSTTLQCKSMITRPASRDFLEGPSHFIEAISNKGVLFWIFKFGFWGLSLPQKGSSACEPRIVFGPGVVMLGPDEQFTICPSPCNFFCFVARLNATRAAGGFG